jgi:hypothetical protein
VIAENFLMNACVKLERINVGKEGIKEVLAQSRTLFIVEESTGVQIIHG